jgi:putative transcriptional regulator
MSKVRAKLNSDGTLRPSRKGSRVTIRGRIDAARVDRTSEAEISRRSAADDAEARKAAAAYALRVRRQTGLTQAAFALRIGVPVDTIRNWEQGKRLPAGPAKALLKVIHHASETVLAALK